MGARAASAAGNGPSRTPSATPSPPSARPRRPCRHEPAGRGGGRRGAHGPSDLRGGGVPPRTSSWAGRADPALGRVALADVLDGCPVHVGRATRRAPGRPGPSAPCPRRPRPPRRSSAPCGRPRPRRRPGSRRRRSAGDAGDRAAERVLVRADAGRGQPPGRPQLAASARRSSSVTASIRSITSSGSSSGSSYSSEPPRRFMRAPVDSMREHDARLHVLLARRARPPSPGCSRTRSSSSPTTSIASTRLSWRVPT